MKPTLTTRVLIVAMSFLAALGVSTTTRAEVPKWIVNPDKEWKVLTPQEAGIRDVAAWNKWVEATRNTAKGTSFAGEDHKSRNRRTAKIMFDRRQFRTAAGVSLIGCGLNRTANAAEPKFIEILKPQVVAEDGFYQGPWEVANNGAEFGERRIFIAYMDNSGQRNDPHNIYVLQYDYETGKWTKSPSLGKPAGGNTNHNAPAIIRDRKGYLHVFFGANAYGYAGSLKGPRYVKSKRPDDVTQWESFSHLPLTGGGKSSQAIIGAADKDNSLHLFGFGKNGGNNSILYSYLDSKTDVWTHSHLVVGPNSNNWHAPEGHDAKIIDDVIHLSWTIMPGNEPKRGYVNYNVFYAKSRDQGKTWTNVSGGSTFSREEGLKQNQGLPNPSYPSEFLVKKADTYGKTCVGCLSNGQSVVLHANLSGVVFSQWTGDKWVSTNVDKGFPLSIGMEVLSMDRIVVYVNFAEPGGITEYVSSNAGETWDKNQIVKADPSSGLTNLIATTVAVPQGHAERILINWTEAYNRNQSPPSNHRKILFLDRAFD